MSHKQSLNENEVNYEELQNNNYYSTANYMYFNNIINSENSNENIHYNSGYEGYDKKQKAQTKLNISNADKYVIKKFEQNKKYLFF